SHLAGPQRRLPDHPPGNALWSRHLPRCQRPPHGLPLPEWDPETPAVHELVALPSAPARGCCDESAGVVSSVRNLPSRPHSIMKMIRIWSAFSITCVEIGRAHV